MNRRGQGSTFTEERRFREHFGCAPHVAAKIWELINPESTVPGDATVAHMMWSLMFLKMYSKEATISGIAGGVKCPMSFVNPQETQKMQQIARCRQETANKRFKQWGCLTQTFRHDIRKHAEVFRAVAVITQLSIQHGEPLFQVRYSDDIRL